jgi:NADPH:quinone reductase
LKAIQFSEFGAAEVLKLKEVERPVPQRDEVLIKVAAAGVSYVDVRTRQGAYNRAETKVGGVKLPNIPGLQLVGRVVEVGALADKSLVNKKVVAAVKEGAYAEYVVASSQLCAPVPEDADEDILAAVPMQGLTAYFMLTASTVLKQGETVLVHAAGSGVGSLAVQIAKILGAAKIIATGASEEKRDYALKIGADAAVNYEDANWTQLVLNLTDGRGVDVLLESIGGDIFHQNFACLATFGRYIIFGSTRGVAKPIEARSLMTKSQSLTGIYMPVFHSRPDLMKAGLDFLVKYVAQGKLDLRIGKSLPLSEAEAAHRLIEERKVVGAVVLRP